MGIQINDEKPDWRSRTLTFLMTPALIYLDIICDILGFQIDGEIIDMKGPQP